MNLEQAINNIVNVLLNGRIELPDGPMTAREHQQLAADVELLSKRAERADELEKEVNSLQGQLDKLAEIDESDEKLEVPEVPDENEVEEKENERTEQNPNVLQPDSRSS